MTQVPPAAAPQPAPSPPPEAPAAPEAEGGEQAGLKLLPNHYQMNPDAFAPGAGGGGAPGAGGGGASAPTSAGLPEATGPGIPGIGRSSNPLPQPTVAAPEAAPPRKDPGEFLFDPNMVKDHRVRAQVRLDLQDLARATQNDDLRLSLVHLGSLLEGIILDYALENRKELELTEGPDVWDFHALAVRLLGPNLEPGQEPVLGLLHACRRLLRPSCQVVHPIIATSAMVQDAANFLKWALTQLGYEGHYSTSSKGGRGGKKKGNLPPLSGIWRATRRGDEDDA